MKGPDNTEWLDKALAHAIGSKKSEPDFEKWQEKHSQAVEMLTSRAGRRPKAGQRPDGIWRTIMKSRITKLAAAAVIVFGVLLAVHLGGGPGAASVAYGISDVPGLLRNAKTLHVKGSHTYYVKGQDPISCPVEYWIDFENLRYRRRAVYRGRTKDGGLSDDYSEHEVVSDTKHRMMIDHTNKTVRFARHSPFLSQLRLRVRRDRDVFMRHFYLESDQLDGFEKAGQEEIDGVVFDIWEKREDRPIQNISYWIDPSTGELGWYLRRFLYDRYMRNEIKYVDEQKKGQGQLDLFVILDENQHEWHEHLLTCIERDKPLADDVFEIEAPAGYTVTTSKEDAPVFGRGYTTFPSAPNTTVSLRYTLSEDGSVIIAWSDRSDTSLESQAALFEDLVLGGPLPELTFVPYALHPAYSEYREKNEAITYVGRHLAHTKEGNIYYEWSIYVPDSEPPKKNDLGGRLTYEALVRRNPDDGQTRRMGLWPDAIIGSREEFDALVLGGMAELSDEGKAPDGISYKSVLELTRQIRQSLGR